MSDLGFTDRFEIHELLALYGHAVDRCDPALLARVFAADAVFDATVVGQQRYVGLPAIVAWFELGKPPHPPFHVGTNFHAFVADGEVRAWSKWVTTDPAKGLIRSGDYEDTLARTEEGWRIEERVVALRYPRP